MSREVGANGGRYGYRAWRAHQRAREQARRPKTPKLACPELAARVTGWLSEWWSPVQISARLRIEHPGDPMMHVSHETIDQALYVQGRGFALDLPADSNSQRNASVSREDSR